MQNNKQYIIVIGNEKGGAGKTTTSVHLIVSLLHLGFKVASIDADCRQQSLSRYLENRKKYAEKEQIDLLLPKHFIGVESTAKNLEQKNNDEQSQFESILAEAQQDSDFIIIDTPGSNTYISRLAHSYADIVVTPINDSFMDLDVLARIELNSINPEKPSIYSQTIWEQKMIRARRDRSEIQWIVIRNRLSSLDAKNKRNVGKALEKISKRLGFKVANGFGERVIFRELFLKGLTLLDISRKTDFAMSISHVAARQELRDFLKSINITSIQEALERVSKNNPANRELELT